MDDIKAQMFGISESEDEREREDDFIDETIKQNDDNYEDSINQKHENKVFRKSHSHSCSSSASSNSSVKSRSRSKSKEKIHLDDLEKNTEKSKELKTSHHSKSEITDKRENKLIQNRSERNSKDRRRSRSRERTPRGSKSHDYKSLKRERRSDSRSKERRSKSSERKRRSRSRERRSRSRDRRSRSRDRRRRSRSRDRRSRSRDRRRSRSRDRRSKSRDRRSRSRDRRRSRSRSRDRYRRSRSHDRDRRRYGHRHHRSRSKPRDFKEKALSNLREALEKTVGKLDEGLAIDGSSLEKPSNLPLNVSSSSIMTPQIVLQQAMAAMSAKAQALTGISLPKYYNPAAVNPLKYAEQVQKRKLLWQANKEKPEQSKPTSATLWENMTFAQDQDGKMTAKFRKLMGIKPEESVEGTTNTTNSSAQEKEKVATVAAPQPEDAVKKQEALFRDLDQQYEMARMSTHTHRGVGLGYTSHSSSNIYPPVTK